jgi:hypothetical protein
VLEGTLSKKSRAEFAAYIVAGNEGPRPEDFRNNAEFRSGKIREAVGLLLSLPEYHAY